MVAENVTLDEISRLVCERGDSSYTIGVFDNKLVVVSAVNYQMMQVIDSANVSIHVQPALIKTEAGSVISLAVKIVDGAKPGRDAPTISMGRFFALSDNDDMAELQYMIRDRELYFEFYRLDGNKYASRKIPIFKKTRDDLSNILALGAKHNKTIGVLDAEKAQEIAEEMTDWTE